MADYNAEGRTQSYISKVGYPVFPPTYNQNSGVFPGVSSSYPPYPTDNNMPMYPPQPAPQPDYKPPNYYPPNNPTPSYPPNYGFQSGNAPSQGYQPPVMVIPPPVHHPPPQVVVPAPQVVITSPPPPQIIQQPTVVVTAGTCPSCRIGVPVTKFTVCGVICAILFFPVGFICCCLMAKKRCSNCGAVY